MNPRMLVRILFIISFSYNELLLLFNLLLPPAFRRMWEGNVFTPVFPFTRAGVPLVLGPFPGKYSQFLSQILSGGYPLTWPGEGGPPSTVQDRKHPLSRTGRREACNAAGGMPLAVTQANCLVDIKWFRDRIKVPVQLFFLRLHWKRNA